MLVRRQTVMVPLASGAGNMSVMKSIVSTGGEREVESEGWSKGGGGRERNVGDGGGKEVVRGRNGYL